MKENGKTEKIFQPEEDQSFAEYRERYFEIYYWLKMKTYLTLLLIFSFASCNSQQIADKDAFKKFEA